MTSLLTAMAILCLDMWCGNSYQYSFEAYSKTHVRVFAHYENDDGEPGERFASAICPIDMERRDFYETLPYEHGFSPFEDCVNRFDDLNSR